MGYQFYRYTFLLIFSVSGFAGLIYESIWSHYLKLFLGHAAYAQTLVLAIFMGGMAIGAWSSSRASGRWPNLLLAYAAIEFAIGVFGIVFHGIFVRATDFAYDAVLPELSSPLLAGIFKWSLGSLLILPQSILLGMTFPLMSAGLIRRFPASPGATLSVLYFTNSIGAVVGVLVSGFVLIDLVGLPGTILTAGLINVVLALLVWAMVKKAAPEVLPATATTTMGKAADNWRRLLLGVALVTGLSSFLYEIGWIRMLSLVLGASTHSFELMLSAFILGLALGGLWIRKRIDAVVPERFLGIVQILMGFFALLSLPLYNSTFDAMQWLLQSVQRNSGGYHLFNVSSHMIAMAVMLPATFCAGMTLPLITFALLHRGYGEKSIGVVYAANTAGAIAGIFLAVHFAMPVLGLKGLLVFGATLDILLGIILIWRLRGKTDSRTRPITWTVAGAIAITGTLLFVEIDLLKQISGVYRHGRLPGKESGIQVLYHQDGKTATVDLLLNEPATTLVIQTNGKPDAAAQLDPRKPATQDEPTMILAAVLPMLHSPQARSVAVIGMGSGLTTNAFLANSTIEQVETIEIEPAMIEGAKGFRPRTEGVYSDPRSRIHIEDAKTFFSTHNRAYDIIVSEPSNPWVSGVASLYTDEFYRHIRRHLNEDGLFVQWIQIYEIETPLVISVLKSISRNFSDYTVYAAGQSDVVVVAKKSGLLGLPDAGKFASLGLRDEMDRVAIRHLQDILIRRIGSRKSLEPLFEAWPIPVNSDYFPILDQNAARSRFLDQNALDLVRLANTPFPMFEMLGEDQMPRDRTEITPVSSLPHLHASAMAVALLDYVTTGPSGSQAKLLDADTRRNVDYLQFAVRNCQNLSRNPLWEEVMFNLAVAVNSHLTRAEAERFWRLIGLDHCLPHLSLAQKRWHALYKAVGARNGTAMAHLASALFRSEQTYSAHQNLYLLTAGMLGHVATGNRDKAYLFWTQHAGQALANTPPNLSLRLLEAHCRELTRK